MQLLSAVQLDEYQEQAHLLDPFLEQLVEPVVVKIKGYAQNLNQSNTANDSVNPARIERVASLLYSYVKSRGYKTISQSFQFFGPTLPIYSHIYAPSQVLPP